MARDVVEPFFESRTYRALGTLRRWTASSVLFSRFDEERALAAALGALVLASVGSVFRSNLGSGVKFLSFALVFAGLAAVTKHVVDAGAE